MKKLVSVILAVCFIFTSVSAFALTGDEIFKEYTNCDAHMKMSLRLEQYPEMLLDELQDDFVDIKKLIDGLNDTGYEADVKLNSNEDFTKMTVGANADFSLPLVLALGSPNFPSRCEGKLDVVLESLQGQRDLI